MSSLPAAVLDALGPAVAPAKRQAARSAEKPKTTEPPAGFVSIEIPLGDLDTKFPNPRLDLRLSDEQAKQMRCMLRGLMAQNARLPNDMPVRTNADVMRWILAQQG